MASDQRVPGRTGGSVHVLEVARGLAARGHDVHVVVHGMDGAPALELDGGVTWHRISWRPDLRLVRFLARRAVAAVAAVAAPEIVIERYYNFGGEGLSVAEALGMPFVLEVNSPVVDHPGSLKAALDAVALVRPLRRWRERLCRRADALVAPISAIVPAFAREKTEIVTWGANVEAFHPDRRSEESRRRLRRSGGVARSPSSSVASVHGMAFTSSRRPPAGCTTGRTSTASWSATPAGGPRATAGDGWARCPTRPCPPSWPQRTWAWRPYDPSRLRQLRLGFYWSPLKIFEYMASGLPTVTIPRAPLTEIVRDGMRASTWLRAMGRPSLAPSSA